jgi:hypothetical protein
MRALLGPNEDSHQHLNGIEVVVRRLGAGGHLNIPNGTGGDIKVHSGEYIVTFASGRQTFLPKDAGDQMFGVDVELPVVQMGVVEEKPLPVNGGVEKVGETEADKAMREAREKKAADLDRQLAGL